MSGTGIKVCTGTGGTGIHVVPNFPKCPVPVLMSYRTYRSVRCRYSRYRYGCRTELTQVSGTGIDVVPNILKCPVPVLMYRNYRSVWYRYESLYRYRRYRYPYRTELTEVSGIGIVVLPKRPVPEILAVDTGGMPRYVPCRTHLFYAVQNVPFGLSTN